ncbi:MAG: GGDEF domain-containing protein [Rhodoplanes sp.]|uniref:GGDEF domain-containing protein n=1 Tax=Rhodoplanes sp. TaxID=1968906 RepID=UPI0017C5A574|nr:GGDEF domain-containing protein [Rhodoplanes sp.]NVO13656.1 GGDEF domain-containing protein [Rhodoplanes sp.]
MRIDLPTLYAVSTLATTVSGLMLLFSWLQNRSATTLAWWGSATLVLVAAGSLLALRGVISDPLSIIAGNCLWLGAYGMMWCGARAFEGRSPRPVLAAAGAVAWLALCQSETFGATPELRVRVFSAITLAYALLIPWEYWRARDPRPMSRWPAIVLLLIQAVLYAARIPLAERLVFPIAPDNVGVLIPLGIVGLLLHFFCMAFLVMAMVKERLELQFRHAALVDPLTGIANRRAFFDRGERILARIGANGGSAALLMIDLDLFKRVNDTLGHEAGDRVLCAFCGVAAELLRPTDLLARTGGEEFACLLPGTATADAVRVAERIRLGFAAHAAPIGTSDILTVSIGVATTASSGYALAALMHAADRALYAAKANGRNRVEWVKDGDPGADGRLTEYGRLVDETPIAANSPAPDDHPRASGRNGSGQRDTADAA